MTIMQYNVSETIIGEKQSRGDGGEERMNKSKGEAGICTNQDAGPGVTEGPNLLFEKCYGKRIS